MSKGLLIQARDALRTSGTNPFQIGQMIKEDAAKRALQAAIDAPAVTLPQLPPPDDHDYHALTQVRINYFNTATMQAYGQQCFAHGMSCKPASGSQYPSNPPAVRAPLTDEQIEEITADNSLDTIHAVARAIEAAHGITAHPIQAQHLPADDTEGGAA